MTLTTSCLKLSEHAGLAIFTVAFHYTFYINSTIPALDLYLGDTKIECGESGSSVSIVSGYGLHDRAIEVQSPAEARGFFL
jgi:hypothetical protein